MNKYIENIPMALLCLYTVKLMVLSNWSYENGIVLVALAAVSGLFHLKAKNEELQKINEILKMQQTELEELKKQNDSIKATISGIKMVQSNKPIASRF